MSGDGVLPDLANIEKAQNLAQPTNDTEVRKVLGLLKGEPFNWTDECQKALDVLNEALIKQLIMAYPNRTGQFILNNDASAVLELSCPRNKKVWREY